MMTPTNEPKKVSWRTIGGICLILVVLFALLWLDLSAHGAAWQFIWARTGEEEPLAQLRGIVEWAGNITRQPLNLAPNVPIDHKTDNPYGINTFLQKEVEEPKMRVQLQMIKDAGFVWLRQEFPWEDLEVDGRGQFTDSRNDYTEDGLPDTVDAWEKYDRIVDLTDEYGLRLIVRLSNPPEWTRANTPDTLAGSLGPPDDFQDFVNYAVAVATHYKGRITHYQVWNEPNIYPEWGEQFSDPVAYTRMLCMTYTALKAVDPDIIVLSGTLAPTISLDGFYGYNDLIYLQNMYDNGAKNCFDIMSVQGYGLFSGPTDQRMRVTTINFARNMYIRDTMVANGDEHKPIWISEAAWNPVLDAELPPEQITQYSNYGEVTEEQAGRYMPLAYERAQKEWPWIGVISYWFFTRPDDSEKSQAFYYFRMVEPDYQPETPAFTPLPVYNSMKDYITSQQPTLYPGVHQAETWQIQHSDDANLVDTESAQFGEALEASELQFTTYGTDVIVRWRGDQAFLVAKVDDVDKSYAPGYGEDSHLPSIAASLEIEADVQWGDSVVDDEGWITARIVHSFSATSHTIELRALPENAHLTFDSITVLDRTAQHITPIAGVSIALAGFVVYVLATAIRRRLSHE